MADGSFASSCSRFKQHPILATDGLLAANAPGTTSRTLNLKPSTAGGGNVPALNDLLGVFGIGFGDALLEGQLALGDEKIYYASGVNIVRFPAGGTLHAAQLADKATAGESLAPGEQGALLLAGSRQDSMRFFHSPVKWPKQPAKLSAPGCHPTRGDLPKLH